MAEEKGFASGTRDRLVRVSPDRLRGQAAL